MLVFPGHQENQAHAGADCAVGDVERGKADRVSDAARLQVKINKIHYGVTARQQPVGEVAGDAAEDEAKRDLAGQRVRVEMMPRKEQRHEGDEGDNCERAVVVAE